MIAIPFGVTMGTRIVFFLIISSGVIVNKDFLYVNRVADRLKIHLYNNNSEKSNAYKSTYGKRDAERISVDQELENVDNIIEGFHV